MSLLLVTLSIPNDGSLGYFTMAFNSCLDNPIGYPLTKFELTQRHQSFIANGYTSNKYDNDDKNSKLYVLKGDFINLRVFSGMVKNLDSSIYVEPQIEAGFSLYEVN